VNQQHDFQYKHATVFQDDVFRLDMLRLRREKPINLPWPGAVAPGYLAKFKAYII